MPNIGERLGILKSKFWETFFNFYSSCWGLHVIAKRIPSQGNHCGCHVVAVIQLFIQVIGIAKFRFHISLGKFKNALGFWDDFSFCKCFPTQIIVKSANVYGSWVIDFKCSFVNGKNSTCNFANIIGIGNSNPGIGEFIESGACS
ncbi:hypothetical protein D3C80_1313540 [compost metagenome]